jgi:hypothetical protein
MANLSRTEAIKALDGNYTKLADLLNGLSDEDLLHPKTIGGGDWSARDLMSHIAYWEELALEALNDWRAGRQPNVELIFETSVDDANAGDQARWTGRSLQEVRNRAMVHQQLVIALLHLTDEEWRAKAPYPTKRRETVGVLLGSILGAPKRPFDHALAHLPDLQAYVSSLGGRAPG